MWSLCGDNPLNFLEVYVDQLSGYHTNKSYLQFTINIKRNMPKIIDNYT